MKLVIIAGGKGTRLGFKEIPKPMVKVVEKPLLEHQILLAKKYGITEIFILSGYLSNVIQDYCGDGSRWGIQIHHVVEDTPLGTAGAVKQLEGKMDDRFMVFYGDTIMDMDLDRFKLFDEKHGSGIGSIIVHPNDHPYDSDLLEYNSEYQVTHFYSKPHCVDRYYTNMVNAALYIFSTDIFKYIPENTNCDFGLDIFPKVILSEKLFAYKSSEYLKDMGTPERLKKVERDILSGKVEKLNLSNKQKAVFLDRDGVINEEVDCLSNIDQFKLLNGTTEAILKLNQSELLIIVVTNQPAIAKGFLSLEHLADIHKKMDTELGKGRAYIDDLAFCPHHPEKGFEGEVEELKIECNCRKPKAGLLEEAAKKFNIDLTQSWMIGDRYTDIKAGKSVGCKTILVKTGHNGNDHDKFPNTQPDMHVDNLLSAVETIFG